MESEAHKRDCMCVNEWMGFWAVLVFWNVIDKGEVY